MRVILYALIVCATCAVAQAGNPYSIAALKDGESLTVRYETVGCFHSAAFSYTIVGDTVSRVDANGVVETAPLSQETSRGLDRLFAYYDGLNGDGGCTTSDTITLTVAGKDGKVIRTTVYEDATCAAGEVDGVVTVYQLNATFAAAAK